MRPTTTTLKKLEAVFEESGYVVRYEKGSFQSGYCLVENRKILIVNKFFDLEGRINCMIDIISKLELPSENHSDATKELLAKLRGQKNEMTPELPF